MAIAVKESTVICPKCGGKVFWALSVRRHRPIGHCTDCKVWIFISEQVPTSGYFKHLKENLSVARKALALCFFHTIHAFFPCKYTEHEYWGLKLHKD